MPAIKSVGWVERRGTQHQKKLKSKPPGVARQQVTFLVLPRKVTQRRRPRFAAASRYPALLDWSGGCGTRAARSDITSDLAGVVCQPSRMASCFISPRRNPLTSPRYSAAHRGGKSKTKKADGFSVSSMFQKTQEGGASKHLVVPCLSECLHRMGELFVFCSYVFFYREICFQLCWKGRTLLLPQWGRDHARF